MQTPKQQMYVALAFLLGVLIGGAYVYVYEPGHGHEPLESEVLE